MVSGVSSWDRYVVPRLIEWACNGRPVTRQRQKVVPAARGRVLEIGVGSGLNFPFYDPSKVESVVGNDISEELLAKAERAADSVPFEVTLSSTSAEHLAFDDDSFDTVLVTYTLCSIPDVASALCESRRVLRPDGRLLFVEHGQAPDASVARWQRRLEPAWKRIGGGCHLTRDVPVLLRDAGFDVDWLETLYLPGPRVLNFNYWGSAKPAG